MHPAELGGLEAFRDLYAAAPPEPNGPYRNIVRAGFEPQYVRPNYLSAIAAS